MRFAIIENGVVSNTPTSDVAMADNWVEIPDGVSVNKGDFYKNGEFVKNKGVNYEWVDGGYQLTVGGFDNLQSSKLKALFNYCDTQLELLATDYPEREAATWPVQLEEAKAYLADNTTPTPFLVAALKHNETVESYANLIVTNNAQWSAFAGSIVKHRRVIEEAINEAGTVEELEAIEVTL